MAACLATEPAGAGAARNDVVVQYWEKWTGVEQDAIQQIVDDFNDTVGKEKHIYVDMLSMSDIDQKTLVATAAGVAAGRGGFVGYENPQFGELGGADAAGRHGRGARDHRGILQACLLAQDVITTAICIHW